MSNVSIADTGKLVRAILVIGSAYFTKTIAFFSQSLSEQQKLATFGETLCIAQTHHGMTSEVALDFTEQLTIVEDFRGDTKNVYMRKEFVQATEIPRLSLQTWSKFLDSHDLLAKAIEKP
ncbi:hypothetical protein BJX70DRAFT_404537 [Aspergillus crustosus]